MDGWYASWRSHEPSTAPMEGAPTFEKGMHMRARALMSALTAAGILAATAMTTTALSAEPPLDPVFVRKVAYRAMATERPELVAAVRTMLAAGFLGQVLAAARETFDEGPSSYLEPGGLIEAIRSHVDGWTMTAYGPNDRWDITNLAPTQACPAVWQCTVRVLRPAGDGTVTATYDVVYHDTRTNATWQR